MEDNRPRNHRFQPSNDRRYDNRWPQQARQFQYNPQAQEEFQLQQAPNRHKSNRVSRVSWQTSYAITTENRATMQTNAWRRSFGNSSHNTIITKVQLVTVWSKAKQPKWDAPDEIQKEAKIWVEKTNNENVDQM